jgi:hypothetical protein
VPRGVLEGKLIDMPKMQRPSHPDFWLLSQALIDSDARADSGQSADDIVGLYANIEAVVYVAAQRARLALRRAGVLASPDVRMLMAATWMDAFVAGVRFQHLKQEEVRQESGGEW